MILTALQRKKFYTTLPQDVFWSSEEKKLMQTMESLLVMVMSHEFEYVWMCAMIKPSG